jgi:hypothetical protein
MKKLVLEMMILSPLSIRGLQDLLQQHTLPSAEIRCGTGWVKQVPQQVSAEAALLPSQESLPKSLNLCGFVSLMRLHDDQLIKGLDEVDGVSLA